MNIYLVRHGQTDWNKNNLMQGQTDVELNETGESQAIQTAQKLKDFQFSLIYSSPLKRTIRTANIIKGNSNLDIILDERLKERSFGDFEGQNNVDFKKYWNYKANLSDNKVEPIQLLFRRVYIFLEELEKKYKNNDINILLVSHNGTSLAISSIINGAVPDNIFEYNMKPCEYRIFNEVNLDKWRKNYGRNKI